MKNKKIRTAAIVLGILMVILVILNFGLNFWLKNSLPGYIKRNSDYLITYKTLNVDVGTGNIFASGITVNSQSPDNTHKMRLQGTADTLIVSRLGLYDLVFNKSLSTSKLTLKKPNLNIILPDPASKKDRKKRDVEFDNINISNGNISIYRHSGQKMLAVKNLSLDIDELQLAEESDSSKLPIVFDKYSVYATNVYFRPDNVYAFRAASARTENGELNIREFAMVPLLSYQQFLKYFPKKRNLFDVTAEAMKFTEFKLKDKNLTFTNVQFEKPVVKMHTTNVKPEEKQKSFTYDVSMENVLLNNAQINILKPDSSPLFDAEKLTMRVSRLVMNEQTAKGNIPFKYDHFNIKGKNLNYASANQTIHVDNIAVLPKSADLRTVVVKPLGADPSRTSMDLSLSQIFLKMNEWEFTDNKLKLDVDKVVLNQLNGTVTTADNPGKKKPAFDGIRYPLKVNSVEIKNSGITVNSKNQPLTLNGLNATVRQIEMNAETAKNSIPFKTGPYSLSTKDFSYRTKFYHISAALVDVNSTHLTVSRFAVKPTVSRAEYIRMIPSEKDLYNITASKITAQGKWDFVSAKPFMDLSDITINQVDANIFRSKIPKDDLTEKPMYSALLRSIKFPLFVQNLNLKNSVLVYEEDTKKSDGPGKLTFGDFNMNVKNLNSGKMKGRPTKIPISITCRFMNASPMKVRWNLDTASMNDSFTIAGNISDLSAPRINPFIEPYLKIRAAGLISDLIFDFNGTKEGIQGTMKLVHENLKISVLKEDGKKNKFLSAVANIFVTTDSGKFPPSVEVEGVERDRTKSFFNMFWRGIEQGLKKTLIGINAPKAEESVKKTVENTKNALKVNKTQLKQTGQEIRNKVESVKEKVQEKKEENKDLLHNIFNKKSGD